MEKPRLGALRKRRYHLGRGDILYEGLPCPKCKGTRRYTETNKCLACRTTDVLAEKSVINPLPDMDERIDLANTTQCLACGSIQHYTRRDGSKWCRMCKTPLIQGIPPRKDRK